MRRKDAKEHKEQSGHSEGTREESIGDCSIAQPDGFFTSTFRMTGSELCLFFALLRVFAAHLRFGN
jgi:hypothetical protein